MNKGKTIFAQLMSLIPEYEFSKCVKRYRGDRHAFRFNSRNQFLVMSFVQFTDRSGLRDIETTLGLCSQDLYHSGLKIMPDSTLAEANKKKDWHIYQDLGYVLMQRAKKLYEGDKFRVDLDEMVCAFDSSTIELCLALCPWAKLHLGKGGIKMHTLMDLRCSFPPLSCRFLTNNFTVDAITIAEFYRERWSVEIFFKWDQATLARQDFLRHIQKCRLHLEMDSHL